MNKIKYSILLITALCISFGYGFADVNDNISVNKTGGGSFSAGFLRPLEIYNSQPRWIGTNEYVKGANYDVLDGTGDKEKMQYTIHGEVGRNVYIKVLNATTTGPNGHETKSLDGGKIRLKLTWTVYTNTTTFYTWSTNTPYLLTPQIGQSYGATVVWAKYEKLEIDSDANSGYYQFDQVVEVSYNPGF